LRPRPNDPLLGKRGRFGLAGAPDCRRGENANNSRARLSEADNPGMAAEPPADPLERLLADAPDDDERVTPEDEAAIVRGLAQLQRGEVRPLRIVRGRPAADAKRPGTAKVERGKRSSETASRGDEVAKLAKQIQELAKQVEKLASAAVRQGPGGVVLVTRKKPSGGKVRYAADAASTTARGTKAGRSLTASGPKSRKR